VTSEQSAELTRLKRETPRSAAPTTWRIPARVLGDTYQARSSTEVTGTAAATSATAPAVGTAERAAVKAPVVVER